MSAKILTNRFTVSRCDVNPFLSKYVNGIWWTKPTSSFMEETISINVSDSTENQSRNNYLYTKGYQIKKELQSYLLNVDLINSIYASDACHKKCCLKCPLIIQHLNGNGNKCNCCDNDYIVNYPCLTVTTSTQKTNSQDFLFLEKIEEIVYWYYIHDDVWNMFKYLTTVDYAISFHAVTLKHLLENNKYILQLFYWIIHTCSNVCYSSKYPIIIYEVICNKNEWIFSMSVLQLACSKLHYCHRKRSFN